MAVGNPLLKLLGIRLPIIHAPMAGISSPAMAAAVSAAGALGSIGVGATDAAVVSGLVRTQAIRVFSCSSPSPNCRPIGSLLQGHQLLFLTRQIVIRSTSSSVISSAR